MRGIVFDIKRYAVNDGPGIRTTVFMKGCPLRCIWCHNPESFLKKIEEYYLPEALGDELYYRKKKIGKEYGPEQLQSELERDALFYDESEGGVTFSGGEPLLQSEFLQEMLMLCKQRHLHTVVDTSGYAELDDLKKIAPYTDLFLFDLKHMDTEKHFELTGVSNDIILSNLDYLIKSRQNLIVRYPKISGCNDSIDNIRNMIEFLSGYDWKPEVNILPYHRIGKDKYDRFNKENFMQDIPSVKQEECKWIVKEFEEAGFVVEIA